MTQKTVIIVILMILLVGIVRGETVAISASQEGDSYQISKDSIPSGLSIRNSIPGEYILRSTSLGVDVGKITVSVDKTGTKVVYEKLPQRQGTQPFLIQQNFETNYLDDESSRTALSQVVARINNLGTNTNNNILVEAGGSSVNITQLWHNATGSWTLNQSDNWTDTVKHTFNSTDFGSFR